MIVEQISQAFGRNVGIFVVAKTADNYFFEFCIRRIYFDFDSHTGFYRLVKIPDPLVAFTQNGQSFPIYNRTVCFIDRFLVTSFVHIKNQPVGQPLKIKRRFFLFFIIVGLAFQFFAADLHNPGRTVNSIFRNQFLPG